MGGLLCFWWGGGEVTFFFPLREGFEGEREPASSPRKKALRDRHSSDAKSASHRGPGAADTERENTQRECRKRTKEEAGSPERRKKLAVEGVHTSPDRVMPVLPGTGVNTISTTQYSTVGRYSQSLFNNTCRLNYFTKLTAVSQNMLSTSIRKCWDENGSRSEEME